MKHAAKLLPSRGASPTSSSMMAPHRLSHSIAKAPPRKIRIIHVLAPEVIRTEARHFRELVQRLTGKPVPNYASSAASPEDASSSSPPTYSGDAAPAIKAEVKEEAETSPEGGGYLSALGVDDSGNEMFFQGLEDLLLMEPGFNF